MLWQKKGRIYYAEDMTHVMAPTPYLLNENIIRIFCGFCDKDVVSRVGLVDLNADDPSEVINVSSQPLLDIGHAGTFDDNGVVPLSVVFCNDKLYLYYAGYQLGVKQRYYVFSGLAISRDGGNSFVRFQQTPILDRSDKELFLRSAPYVLKESDIWKMWYIAGSEWTEKDGKMVPVYTLKYLESSDGITWGKEGHTCMELCGDEHGFGRPYVVKKEDGTYAMYYSIRGIHTPYHLGYAESEDGKNWVRKDEEMNLTTSSEGWDSEAISYSAVFCHKDRTYLFYNGNDFGRTGFGWAELVS